MTVCYEELAYQNCNVLNSTRIKNRAANQTPNEVDFPSGVAAAHL